MVLMIIIESYKAVLGCKSKNYWKRIKSIL